MAAPPSKIRAALRWTLVAALAFGLLYWFLRGVDLASLARRMLEVEAGPLLLGFLFTIGHYPLRAWRWKFLLRPLGETPFSVRLNATVAGYAVNNLLPARSGEVARPYLLARRTGLPFSGALATVVVERLLDMVTVVGLFLVSLPLVLADPEEEEVLLRRPLLILALMAALAVAAWIVVRYLRGPLRGAGGAMLRLLPVRFQERAGAVARSFGEGFGALRRGHLIGWIVVGSLAVWADIALANYFVVKAFAPDFPLTGALFLMGFLATGIAIPTPAGVGGFDAFGKECLHRFFQMGADLAAGVTLVLHAFSVVPITIWGLGILWAEGLRPGALGRKPETELGGKIPEGSAGAD